MSAAEAAAMNETGVVQAPLNGAGATHVTVPPNPSAFDPPRGSTQFFEFDVANAQLRIHDAAQGWGRIFGPESFEARFMVSKGLTPPTAMPRASNIVQTASALRR